MEKNGFSLLEAIVALGVITIGMLGVLQVFPLAFGLERSNLLQTQAVFAAQEKMEELLSFSALSVGIIVEDSLPFPNERFSRTAKVSYVDADLNETASPTGLKKIEVTVSWKSPLRIETKQTKLVSLAPEK